jgi:hypothetical protein
MKNYNERVRWNFELALHGYGKNIKEALLDALTRMHSDVQTDLAESDLESIEKHEVISIDVTDIDEE